METKKEEIQHGRPMDEKRDPESDSNSTANEKSWDPKNDPDEDWGTKDDDEDEEKTKEKDPDEKVKY